jgi:threonyl-tRNA synthetase
MEQIDVTFEDGATERLPAGISAREALIAHARNGGGNRKLVERAIAARLDGNRAGATTVVDLSRPLVGDCRVAPVPPDSAEGLDVIRHSSAHLMAQAVKRLFPETEITIGPVIENGFYYDFKRPGGFVAEDLPRIEETMRAIVKEDLPVRREEVAKDEAIRRFRAMGEHYKAEIIASIPGDEPISLYTEGQFTDLCRGPHVPSTGRIPAFRLTSLAGAYWRGDARNEQLQRIYGTAWASGKDLEAYLARVEEAKQRDHRRIGQALDLFSLHPIAPGSPFFHPKGAVVYNLLVQFVRGLYGRYGYTEVITPLVYKTELYKTSGHYDLFKDDMFLLTVEEEEYGVKPMNCPGHCYLYAIGKHSYRDLRSATPTSAGSTASSRRGRSRVSRASAPWRRTTRTSTARRSTSTPSSSASSR